MNPVQSAEPSTVPAKKLPAATLRRLARAPWDYLMMALGLAYWGFFGSILTLIALPLHLLLPQRIGHLAGRRLLHLLFRHFVVFLRGSDLVRADLSAFDHLPTTRGSFIVAPNHTSLWDAVFIIARLPSAICVMKKSILANPVLGGGARLAGYIANDRITRMIRDASQSLKDGGHLLLFPEGTRTRPTARWINPLKGGCAIIAIKSGVPIYPLFIRSDTRFLQKGWPLWRRPVFPIHLTVEIGTPLHPLPGETAHQLTDRLSATFEQELARPHPLRRQASG